MDKIKDDGIIEFICEGGSGGEALVNVELRTKFPGLGGTIITQEGVVSALREEYNFCPLDGHKMFLKHTLLKKLEDYFYRTHVYDFAHIPRPLGSISDKKEPYEAYLYEWVFGMEGFPWEKLDNNGDTKSVLLKDWNKFVGNFLDAGIKMSLDITDPDDGRISKNIIYQFSANINNDKFEMSSIWKRIDFGPRSINIDYDKLSNFMKEKESDLIKILRKERYQMVELILKYLTKRKNMKDVDIGRLEILVGDYRRKTLQHYSSRGSGLADTTTYFDETTESLI